MVIVPTEKRFDWQHSPLVLFGLVLLNVLVFFVYQSGDGMRLERAFAVYHQQNLLELEWPLYRDYLTARDQQALVSDYQSALDEGYAVDVARALLLDFEFKHYLAQEGRALFTNIRYEDWDLKRSMVNDHLDSMSFLSGGLIPSEMNLLSLISYQFLHGDIMHLLGNMFFLVVCGFAVEAAIGHLRFLLFYLITGAVGGVAHAFLDTTSTMPLVGASGAVSGVMAMYLGVFRLKKIEFFYWFFIFVGYFRAPALLILPVYMGKEVFDYFNSQGSNVAFMAHAGGFGAGALLMGLSLLANPKLLNSDYVEQDQESDPYREALAKVYEHLGSFQFRPALQAVNRMIKQYGLRSELAVLRSQILKIDGGESFRKSLAQALSVKDQSPRSLNQQANLWREHPECGDLLNEQTLVGLAFRFATREHLNTAETVLAALLKRNTANPEVPTLARKLARIAAEAKDSGKQQYFLRLAQRPAG
ncbi:rhomboid family intramembrane serine protease [Gilvimarinus sp. F26214L]|uniref:rhomboid family intramembrane serine protease n=1 Tax=Gilvimarinus sp. DZF01 TaxID=3461371 RepID=UPI004045ABAE